MARTREPDSRNSQGAAGTAAFAGALLLSLLGTAADALAQTEIHRCAQADGTVAFQETPCPEAEAEPAATDDSATTPPPGNDDNAVDNPFDSPYDNPDFVPDAAEPDDVEVPPFSTRAECEEETRDAIDAIDLEMRKGYSREQGQAYLAELLQLTQQLRACNSL